MVSRCQATNNRIYFKRQIQIKMNLPFIFRKWPKFAKGHRTYYYHIQFQKNILTFQCDIVDKM